ncbi:MAG: DUF1080 domain-containing protein [Planctomycetota bacterium]|nr:MAG: DUF1080 domain-containing protein [Planctomycetota bacterium]
MKRFVGLPIAFLSVAALVWADDKPADKPAADKDGWVSLFDGKTLEGWKANEHPENWKVEDGAIVGRGPRSHLFCTAGDFTDFEFSTEVMTEKGTNSGIYFHTEFQKDGWPEKGHEAQVNVTQGDPVKTGSLYNVKKVFKTEAKDGEWWTQTIKVEGKHITISVNGKVVVDYTEPDDVKGGRKLSKGTFAFQQHDPGGVVRYRNVKVRKLDKK